MSEFKRIDASAAQDLFTNAKPIAVDIRDPASYLQAHISGAIRLDNSNLEDFIEATAKDTPILVYCYHGHSSQGAAQYLCSQGFSQVYSLDGGFEQCRSSFSTSSGE